MTHSTVPSKESVELLGSEIEQLIAWYAGQMERTPHMAITKINRINYLAHALSDLKDKQSEAIRVLGEAKDESVEA